MLLTAQRIQDGKIGVDTLLRFVKKQGKRKEIKTAAKLILSDIREAKIDDNYPTEDEISDINFCENLQPKTLRKFLEVLIKPRFKKGIAGPFSDDECETNVWNLPNTFWTYSGA